MFTMSIDQLTAEAMRLPAKERALLASHLWESLEDPNAANGDLDEIATLNLAAERNRQIESGEVQAISHAEMMARLRR